MVSNKGSLGLFGINRKLKRIIKIAVPRTAVVRLFSIYSRFKYVKAEKAKHAFNQAAETPIWLEPMMLERLQKEYPFLPGGSYEPEDLDQKGKEHAKELISFVQKGNVSTFLELGCGDGMVSCHLQRMGKIATAIDIRTNAFDIGAVRQGVRLLQMDASHLEFPSESFDFIFSYASFEHFAEPELVLREAIRVVKPKGWIYLFYGPLYMSPLHAYRLIT